MKKVIGNKYVKIAEMIIIGYDLAASTIWTSTIPSHDLILERNIEAIQYYLCWIMQ